MRTKIKFGVLLLSICMILSIVSIMSVSAADTSKVTLSVDKTEVNVGDTVTVVIENDLMTVTSFGVYLSFDNTLLECTSVDGFFDEGDGWLGLYKTKGRPKEVEADIGNGVEDTNSDGIFSFGILSIDETEYEGGIIATLKFTAIKAGTVTITLEEQSAGTDGYKGVVATQTVTIKSATPACEHTSTKLVPNNDGTHNVVCANTECGATVTPNVTCTGTDDGDCTTAVTCECGYVVTAAKAAHVAGEDDGDCTTAIKCVNCAKNAVEAKEKHTGGTATCTAQAKCEVCGTAYGALADHSFLNNNRGSQLTAGDCTNAATYATKCDNCDYEDKAKVITGEKDSTNHTGEVKYTNNGDTHSAAYTCCGAPVVTNEAHSYEDADTCICGAVKAPEHVCADNLTHVPANTATCAATGNLEHYKCTCGKLYKDAEAVNEADPENVILPIDPDNHVWGEVTYSWAFVNKKYTCTATRTCTVHTETSESATSIKSSVTERIYGDCTKNESTIEYYTPVFDVEWATAEFGLEDRYPGKAVSHSYGYRDNGDGKTHTQYCKNGCTYFKERPAAHTYNKTTHKCTRCGAVQPTGWTWVEKTGVWNYLYEDYSKATGLTRVPYNTELGHGANADDLAYFNANSETSKYTDAESAVYYFAEDGELIRTTGIVVEGETTRYAVDGVVAWHVGLVEVEGEYYYFAGDVNGGGNVMATGRIYVTRNTTDLDITIGGVYIFGEDGKMTQNDGIVDIEGTLYYYEDGRLAIDAGLIEVDGNYYYVRSTDDKAGQVVVGRKYWVSNTNGYFAAGMYEFDENGKMIIDSTVNANGIVEIDGVYYYYVGGVKQVGAGVVELTDAEGETFYIYVKSNGTLATGEYWPTTTNGELERGCYDWGTDGKYYPAN